MRLNEKLKKHENKDELIKKIEENDFELYKILNKTKLTLDQKVAIYLGDGINE